MSMCMFELKITEERKREKKINLVYYIYKFKSKKVSKIKKVTFLYYFSIKTYLNQHG